MLIKVEFDDIIYRLQRFGGVSEYWTEITSRTAASGDFEVDRRPGHVRLRGLPVLTQAGVFHSSHFRIGVGRGVRNVATVHDLIFEFGLAGQSVGAWINTMERRLCYSACDALICISKNTRDDLLKHYPALHRKHIDVIPHGLSSDLQKYKEQRLVAAPEARAVARRHLLYVGGRVSYKNFPGALAGYKESGLAQQGVQLLCTGGKFTLGELALIDELGLKNCVVSTGLVTRDELFHLYESAIALLYPSTYEGFGLPVLEAMALECPVVACHASSIPEVAGDAALLIPPGNSSAIAAALKEVANTPQVERQRAGVRHAAKFSWDHSARQHMELYRTLAS